MYKILLQRNIIKKVAALRENYLNISVTLVTDLEEILLSISRMVFQKVTVFKPNLIKSIQFLVFLRSHFCLPLKYLGLVASLRKPIMQCSGSSSGPGPVLAET